MAQYKADQNILTTADSGARHLSTVLWFVFHTTENSDSTPPENVARWQLDRKNGSSYNGLIGTTGRTIRSNDDNFIPWSAGKTGNRLGFHWSFIGYAKRTRADWLKHPTQLEKAAQIAAHYSREYGIPLRWLTVEQVRSRKVKGFCGHREISLAFGEVNHTDPGAGFPYDLVLARAKEILNPTPAKKEETMSERQIRLIFEQLAGPEGEKFTGWPQLGGRTLVDGLGALGAHLGVPGFKDIKGQIANKADQK